MSDREKNKKEVERADDQIEEKILETVTLPIDEINAELAREKNAEEEDGTAEEHADHDDPEDEGVELLYEDLASDDEKTYVPESDGDEYAEEEPQFEALDAEDSTENVSDEPEDPAFPSDTEDDALTSDDNTRVDSMQSGVSDAGDADTGDWTEAEGQNRGETESAENDTEPINHSEEDNAEPEDRGGEDNAESEDHGGEDNAESEDHGDEDGEKEEKILETVTLPTEEINAELKRQEAEKSGAASDDGDNAESTRKSRNPFAAIGRWFKRAKIWQRVVAIVIIVVLAAGLAGYGYFHSKYILMDYSTGEYHSDEDLESSAEESTQDEMENDELAKRQIEEAIPEQSSIASTQEVEQATGVVNILLIGTDDRTKTFSKNARGDTCILLSINRDQNKAHLVSFERATGVKVLSGEYEGQWDWLTHMFWYGGPAMMTEEIRENFKVDVTKYIRVNIFTFMELLESIDGVDIELTQAEADNINHPGNTFTAGNEKRAIALGYTVQTDLVAGMNHLDPGTAMCYARLRAIDDDWHRVVRQRKVILAAIEKLKKMNLTDLDALLNNVLPLVQTNLTESDVASLLPEALNFVNMEYDSITFPLRHTYGLMDGMQGRKVLAVDFDTNSQELQNLLYGDATTEELTEKYENTPSDYNYKDSETYQQNYSDAESAVGKSTSTATDTGVSANSGYVGTDTSASSSSASSVGTGAGTAGSTAAAGTSVAGTSAAVTSSAGADTDVGADAAAGVPDPVSSTIAGGAGTPTASVSAGNSTGTAAASTGSSGTGASAAGSTGTSGTGSSSPGEVVSTSTDPATGVVTTIYYNEETGVRTVVATHPTSGATTVSATDLEGNTQTVHQDADGNVTTQTSKAADSASAGTGTASSGAAGTSAGASNATAGTGTQAVGAGSSASVGTSYNAAAVPAQ